MENCVILKSFGSLNNPDLPEVVVVTEATREKLSVYQSITEDMMYYFQKFINTIGGYDGSLYSKIKRLYIPMFSTTNGQACYDIVSGSIIYPDSTTTFSNDIELGEGAIPTPELQFVYTTNKGSGIFLACEPMQTGNILVGNLAGCSVFTFATTFPNVGGGTTDLFGSISKNLLLNTGNAAADCCYILDDNNIKKVPSTYDTSGLSESTIFRLFTNITNQETARVRLWGLTSGLSFAEAEVLNKAVNTLIDDCISGNA